MSTSAPRADAAVEQHGELVADRVDDARQRVERGDRAVDLAAAVVGDDDAVDAARRRARARVVGVQDALEDDRQPRLLAQPRQVVPRQRRVGELADPVADRGAWDPPRAALERRRGRPGRLK